MTKKGFTLAEVLIALAIIGVAFAVLAATQVTTLQVTSESRHASDTTDFANRALENAVQDVLLNFSDRLGAGQQDCAGFAETTRFKGTCTVGPEGSDYLEAGLIRVTVTMTEPSNVLFTRLVSCIDAQPAPTIADPAPCPESGG